MLGGTRTPARKQSAAGRGDRRHKAQRWGRTGAREGRVGRGGSPGGGSLEALGTRDGGAARLPSEPGREALGVLCGHAAGWDQVGGLRAGAAPWSPPSPQGQRPPR